MEHRRVSLVLSPTRLNAERVRSLWSSDFPSSTTRLNKATKEFHRALLSSAQKLLISSDTLEKLEGTSSHLAGWADQADEEEQQQQQERRLFSTTLFSIDTDTHMPAVAQIAAPSPLFSIDTDTQMPPLDFDSLQSPREDEEEEEEEEVAIQEEEEEEGAAAGGEYKEEEEEADRDPPTTVFAHISHMQPNNSSNTLTHAEKDDLLQALVEENARLKAKVNEVVETAAAALREAESFNASAKKEFDRQLARAERANMSLRVENGALKGQAAVLQERLAAEEAEVKKAARLVNKFRQLRESAMR